MNDRSTEPDARLDPAASAASATDDLASWRDVWQESGQSSGALAGGELAARIERVRRGSRRFGFGLIALTAGELLFSLCTIGFLGYWAWLRPDVWRLLLVLLGMLLVVVAQVFTLKNRRGTYRPRNQTTQAFVELEWLRAHRQLRTIRFSLRFLLFEIAAIAALRFAELVSQAAPAARLLEVGLSFVGFLLPLAAVIVPALWLWHRTIRRKIAELEPLHAAFRRDEPYDAAPRSGSDERAGGAIR